MRSEAEVQSQTLLDASSQGSRLFRNNSGAFEDAQGRWVRYGLGNMSKRVNQITKSSDLIGITPIVVTEDMVGTTVGIFTAVECKKEGWVYTGTGREVAQKNFIDLITFTRLIFN